MYEPIHSIAYLERGEGKTGYYFKIKLFKQVFPLGMI